MRTAVAFTTLSILAASGSVAAVPLSEERASAVEERTWNSWANFGNVLIPVASGGKQAGFGNANLGWARYRGTQLRVGAFSGWMSGVCYPAYNDWNVCGELGAFNSAAYWASVANISGPKLFAALGSTRTTRWRNLISGVCGTSAAPSSSCSDVLTQFDSTVTEAAGLRASQYRSAYNTLNGYGLFESLDSLQSATEAASSSSAISIAERAADVEEELVEERDLLEARTSYLKKLAKTGYRLGAYSGIGSDGAMLVGGKPLATVLAGLPFEAPSSAYVTIGQNGVYLVSTVRAANYVYGNGFHKRDADADAVEERNVDMVVDLEARTWSWKSKGKSVATSNSGTFLGAFTGISNGVIQCGGQPLPTVLAKYPTSAHRAVIFGTDGLWLI